MGQNSGLVDHTSSSQAKIALFRSLFRGRADDRLAAIPRDEARAIVATGKYIGEKFDDPRLDTLCLTLPVSW